MKIFLIILMFLLTVYAMQQILERSRKVVVDGATGEPMAGVACVVIAIITIVFDVLLAYMVIAGI